MPRFGATPLSFPDFTGATRRLVLVNLVAFFLLLLAQLAFREASGPAIALLGLRPSEFLSGYVWQPFTYSLIHPGLLGTLFELLSIWFLGSILEAGHGARWLTWLFIVSVLGTAVTAILIYAISAGFGAPMGEVQLTGCLGGIFGLLVAVGVLHGDLEFLLLFIIGIKAKYLAAIYALIAFAMLFGEQRMYAFAELGGALAALLYIRMAPRRGLGFVLSEGFYGVRNRYYRWKRRRTARKFEVYMRKQGRTVRFDGQGRIIDEEQLDRDQDDKKRWN
jgi:membrane associated rhomboid family serine protease